jgi:hypothetical protein
MEPLDSPRLRINEKEKCFKEAMDTYQKAVNDSGDKLKWEVKDHQLWGQKLDGTWHQVNNMSWQDLNLETIKTNARIRKWINDGGNIGDDPFKAGKDYWYQARVPDFTVRTPDGKTLVVDNKFTRKSDCSKDEWGKKKGYNGNTQREDYNDINKKNNPGANNVQDLYLDRDICQCQPGEPQNQEAQAPHPDPEGTHGIGETDRLKGTRIPSGEITGGRPALPKPPEPVGIPRPPGQVVPGRIPGRVPNVPLRVPIAPVF